MKKYLMSVFERSTDCKSAYETICEYDNVFRGNIYERFCMCLKFGEYEIAKKHLHAVIEQNKKAFMRNKEALGNSITQEYIQKMEKKIAEKQKLLDLINAEDYINIQKWINYNESKNKQNLRLK